LIKISMFTRLIFNGKNNCTVIYRCKPLKLKDKQESVFDRQEKLPSFNQQAYSSSRIILIGAGGLGGQCGEGLTRKGIGELVILDPDVVEPSNLSRQKFYKSDLYKNKAIRLARNLAKEGFSPTRLQGIALSFQDAVDAGFDLLGNVAICGVDNNPTRVFASRFYRERNIPVIFTAVSAQADHGYVFIQTGKKDDPCFGCLFPKSVNDDTYPCPGTPAVLDILKTVAGIVTYAVDSLIMKRLRIWGYKDIFLDGTIPGADSVIERRINCKLCRGRGGE
jgi:molybdopterin/thiamine biosynthesis adenylyltransferase